MASSSLHDLGPRFTKGTEGVGPSGDQREGAKGSSDPESHPGPRASRVARSGDKELGVH